MNNNWMDPGAFVSQISFIGIGIQLAALLLFVPNSQQDAGSTSCSISRTSSGGGFHRELVTSIAITSQQFEYGQDSIAEIVLVETLPPSMYMDLYQTSMLEDFGGPKIYSSIDIDVEKPAFNSKVHTVYVYGSPKIVGSKAELKITVPVHLRYNRPSADSDFYQISLSSPSVHIRFLEGPWLGGMGRMVLLPCENGTDIYWSRVICSPAKGDGTVKFSVPVGKAEHTTLVVIGTLTVTVAAMLYLISVANTARKQKED